jgi:hypothetical protein
MGQRKRRVHEQNYFLMQPVKQFLFFKSSQRKTICYTEQCRYNHATCHRHGEPMFKSLPLTIRKIQATEARLNRIYDAAKLGLKGDTLALAAGMRPEEFRQLCELDPMAQLAAQKGKADGEQEMSTVLHTAAREGDAKAALEILKHSHDWVAKQQVQVEVNQQISILGALAEAERRAANVVDVTDVIAHAPTKPLTARLAPHKQAAQ